MALSRTVVCHPPRGPPEQWLLYSAAPDRARRVSSRVSNRAGRTPGRQPSGHCAGAGRVRGAVVAVDGEDLMLTRDHRAAAEPGPGSMPVTGQLAGCPSRACAAASATPAPRPPSCTRCWTTRPPPPRSAPPAAGCTGQPADRPCAGQAKRNRARIQLRFGAKAQPDDSGWAPGHGPSRPRNVVTAGWRAGAVVRHARTG